MKPLLSLTILLAGSIFPQFALANLSNCEMGNQSASKFFTNTNFKSFTANSWTLSQSDDPLLACVFMNNDMRPSLSLEESNDVITMKISLHDATAIYSSPTSNVSTICKNRKFYKSKFSQSTETTVDDICSAFLKITGEKK